MGEPSKELLDLPSEPRPAASFIGGLPPSLTLFSLASTFNFFSTFWSVELAESLLAGRDQQQQDKEGKRKPEPPTAPLPKSQGTVLPAIQLIHHIVIEFSFSKFVLYQHQFELDESKANPC